MPTSKALHIPFLNYIANKKMKRQSCEEIPFIFLFHQYWNNNNKNAQNQNYHIHVLVNPKIHAQGHMYRYGKILVHLAFQIVQGFNARGPFS